MKITITWNFFLIPVLGLIILALAACGGGAPAATSAPAEAPAAAAPALAPAEVFATPLIIISTPASLKNTPLPQPRQAITSINLGQIQQLARWDVSQASEANNLPTSLAFTMDGALLAIGKQDGSVELMRMLDGRPEYILGGQGVPVARLAVSPIANTLAAGLQNGDVQLWSIEDGSLLGAFVGLTSEITGLSFSPDGGYLVAGGRDGVGIVWSVGDGSIVQRIQKDFATSLCLSFSPFTTSSQPPYLLGLAWENGEISFLQPPDWSSVGDYMTGVQIVEFAFSPAFPPRLAVASRTGNLTIWGIDGTMESGLQPTSQEINCLAISPYDDIAATASLNGVELSDLQSLQAWQLYGAHTHSVLSLAFSPDGRYLASTGLDGMVLIWGVIP